MRDKNRVATVEEYFELELASERRYEYVDCEIRLLAGGTPNHNFIVGNLLVAWKSLLREQSFDIFALNQRLWLPRGNIFTYPNLWF